MPVIICLYYSRVLVRAARQIMTVPRRAPAAAFSGIIAVNLHMRFPRRQPRSGVPGVVATLHCSWCNRATAVVCRLGLDELRHELLGRATPRPL